MNATSLVCLKSQRGAIFEIPPGQTAVGRPPLRGLAIRNRAVSRPHALIERQGQLVWLTDLNSKNGTYVNSERLASGDKRLLMEGDVVRFSRKMKGLTIAGNQSLRVAASETAIASSGIGEHATYTRDAFGFEPNVIEFAKLGIAPNTAATLAKRFRPVRFISTGGMGQIILAQDMLSGRFVALKVMLRNLLHCEPYVQQFIREAVITARLQHPHIIPVYDLGFFTDNQLYYTMRYVSGKSFDLVLCGTDRLQKLKVLGMAARGLAHAHDLGLWHRDLKPQNILVGELGDVYVIDWGLVSVQPGSTYQLTLPGILVQSDTIVLPDNLLRDTPHALTTGPGLMGPLAYMAPEQIAQDHARSGIVSDVWAIGIMLFEVLVGRHPLEDVKGDSREMLANVLTRHFPAPVDLEPLAPPRLSELCQRMLVKDPAVRMKNLREFIEEIDAYIDAQGRSSSDARSSVDYRPIACRA
jgi:hypothetical protein